MKHLIHKIAMALLAVVGGGFLNSPAAWAAQQQRDSMHLSFYFRQGDDLLMRDYRDNEATFDTFAELMSCADSGRISSIEIIGSTSPEGPSSFNELLARRRAEAIRGYLRWKHPSIDESIIKLSTCDDCFLRAIENNPNVPRRDKVLEILRSPSSMETKWANIQLLSGGVSEYIENNLSPRLRNAVSCVITFDSSKPDEPQVTLADLKQEETPIAEIVTVTETEQDTTTYELQNIPDEVIIPGDHITRKPLLALKTNLLFDAATLLNLEVEVPIGKHFSVAAEWIFPWWLWEKKQNCLQMMSGNIEGKYWFGNRTDRPQMTGWFAGLYVGGGYYDLERNRKGYQGEFFIATGISGGYAHTINKSGTLRMEYSLGVGYMQTNYRKYEAKMGDDNEWHLYRRESGTYSWLGPTRARVSLVWMINGKKRGGYR